MHDFLDSLKIEHEFEILEGADHHLNNIWLSETSHEMINGIYELKLHAEAWNK